MKTDMIAPILLLLMILCGSLFLIIKIGRDEYTIDDVCPLGCKVDRHVFTSDMCICGSKEEKIRW